MHPALHVILGHHPMAEGGPVGADGAGDDGTEMSGLHMIAEDLITAVHSGDASKVAECLEDAFELLEMQPHEESAHEE